VGACQSKLTRTFYRSAMAGCEWHILIHTHHGGERGRGYGGRCGMEKGLSNGEGAVGRSLRCRMERELWR